MSNQYGADREYKQKGGILYLKCTKCGKRLTLYDYPKDRSKKFGVRADCRECHRVKMKKYHRKRYVNNRDKSKAYSREYYVNNRDYLNTKEKDRILSKNLGFDRYSFHHKARYFIKNNKLKPKLCPICGAERNIEIHHPSYKSFNDWSVVVFCCKYCHRNIHTGDIKCPKPIDLLNMECNSP